MAIEAANQITIGDWVIADFTHCLVGALIYGRSLCLWFAVVDIDLVAHKWQTAVQTSTTRPPLTASGKLVIVHGTQQLAYFLSYDRDMVP